MKNATLLLLSLIAFSPLAHADCSKAYQDTKIPDTVEAARQSIPNDYLNKLVMGAIEKSGREYSHDLETAVRAALIRGFDNGDLCPEGKPLNRRALTEYLTPHSGTCTIKIQKMDPATGDTSDQNFDFSTTTQKPSREGRTFTWTSYRSFIFEVQNKEGCDSIVQSLVTQYGKNSLKFLASEFEGEEVVVTQKRIKTKLHKVANQNGGIFGGFVSSYEITDKYDSNYRVGYYR